MSSKEVTKVTTDTTSGSIDPGGTNLDKDVFALASELEKILQGQSNKTLLKVFNMVGSLHGIRAIPVDRPIGRSTAGTTKVVPVVKHVKGVKTPEAAWKKTNAYKRLSSERAEKVKTIKALNPGVPNTALVEELRVIEQQLKALKSPTVGDH